MNIINQPPTLLFCAVFFPLMILACAYKAGPENCIKFIVYVVTIIAAIGLAATIGLI